jgi:hypothetical protein
MLSHEMTECTMYIVHRVTSRPFGNIRDKTIASVVVLIALTQSKICSPKHICNAYYAYYLAREKMLVRLAPYDSQTSYTSLIT